MSDVPIRHHALLSDCTSAALVTSRGSVDWLCLPRFDSTALFARLLDADAGYFLLAPVDEEATSTWHYRPHSLVLETDWVTPSGELKTTDALALGRHERGHELGRESPGVLLRSVRCTRGRVRVAVELVPRPEFGLVHPRLERVRGGVVAHGGSTVTVLSSSIDLDVTGGLASAVVDLEEGDTLAFAVEQSSTWSTTPATVKPRRIHAALTHTTDSWRSWSELHQRYDGPWRDLVHHSGVVLQGLTFARTGAVVAAPTTSLPEGVGSGRTWDYRFSWVRDASMTLQALFLAACPDEAGRFFSFLATAAATQLDRGVELQIMFGIAGERDLSERELPHLTGWRDSGPVRVGNGAWDQRQLDVYGALLDAAYTLREQLTGLDPSTRHFLVGAVDAAAARWQDDDQGIWELRGPARPFVHSKLMCWVALDRGLALADLLEVDGDRCAAWTRTREEIRDAILSRGWSEKAQAYTQFFGSDELDASVLLMAVMRFLPPDDARLLSTIDAVESGLSDDRGLVYRYRDEDGFDSKEGTFLLCTFWLAHALAVTGQVDRAGVVLDRAAAQATDLGLLAEQVDPETGELLGNFPQAFSHIGLINAAGALAAALDLAPEDERRAGAVAGR